MLNNEISSNEEEEGDEGSEELSETQSGPNM